MFMGATFRSAAVSFIMHPPIRGGGIIKLIAADRKDAPINISRFRFKML